MNWISTLSPEFVAAEHAERVQRLRRHWSRRPRVESAVAADRPAARVVMLPSQRRSERMPAGCDAV